MTKILKISLLLLALIIVPALVFAQVNTNMNANKVKDVTVKELTDAGFTDPTLVKPAAGKFLQPIYYFRVKETTADTFGWGDVSNLVVINIFTKIESSWQYNNGLIEINDISGRTQARVTNAKYYIVVTGPDRDKVIKLTNELKDLYID